MTAYPDALSPVDALMPASSTFRDQQIAYWRSEARQNWLLGFMDLARLCEGFASEWEWEAVTCIAS